MNNNDTTSSMAVRKDTLISPDALENEVTYKAEDSLIFDIKTKKIYLYGNAEVYYKDIELKAAFIELSMDSNTVFSKGLPDSTGTIVGKPVFTESEKSFEARTMRYNFKTKKGKITDVVTQEGEGYIHGDQVKKMEDDVLYIKDGLYTTCSKPHPHFHLFSNKLKVIPEDKVITKFSYLVIEDVPTPLMLPFGIFPNKTGKASGIVIPEIGEDATLGFSLTGGGYYWAINDYMDLQLVGDLYSKGSWRAEALSQYKKRYKFNGKLNFSHFNKKIGFPESPDYKEKKEFFFRWNHKQAPKARPGSRFTADVNAGTRTNFNNNPASTAEDYLTNTFTSNISYTKRFGNLVNVNLNARHNQNTQTGKVNLSLPEAALTVNRFFPFKNKKNTGKDKFFEKIGFSYNMNAKNELDTYDSLIVFDNLQQFAGDFQYGVKHNLPVSTNFKLLKNITVNPSANFSSVSHFSTIRKRFDNSADALVTDTINEFRQTFSGNLSTSMSTKIYGLFQFKKGWVKAIRHVMTPQLGFSYIPENNSGLMSYADTAGNNIEYSIFSNGIYGAPNRKESGRINFSLINNLESKVRSRGDTASAFKKLKLIENLNINSSYDLIADSLNISDIRISAFTTLFNNVKVNYNQVITPYKNDLTGNKIDETYFESEGVIGRTRSARLALSFNMNNNTFTKKSPVKKGKANKGKNQGVIPWNINLSHNLDYSKPHSFAEAKLINTLRFNGNIELTENWKVEVQSGYDMTEKEFSYTQFNFYRDLHCWEMKLQWVPFGPQKRYMFTLNVKAPTLQDLRIKRRRTSSDVNNF